ncbi:unnamed protein product [Pleuronectes platessa]|uniref:Uncharacterized protein n=1 Tax=Pleuronectes platessa TaxID=8262 RepID=A0A9N7VB98_PLEPL|nr:unnamed protein product [Pleuronectes platessa]
MAAQLIRRSSTSSASFVHSFLARAFGGRDGDIARCLIEHQVGAAPLKSKGAGEQQGHFLFRFLPPSRPRRFPALRPWVPLGLDSFFEVKVWAQIGSEEQAPNSVL